MLDVPHRWPRMRLPRLLRRETKANSVSRTLTLSNLHSGIHTSKWALAPSLILSPCYASNIQTMLSLLKTFLELLNYDYLFFLFLFFLGGGPHPRACGSSQARDGVCNTAATLTMLDPQPQKNYSLISFNVYELLDRGLFSQPDPGSVPTVTY